MRSPELEEMLKKVNPDKVEKRGGSLKTVDVAKGRANLFLCPTTSVMNHWDLCAPSLILQEAGGRITDKYGNAFDYSQRDTTNRNGVIASNSVIHDNIVARLAGG